jgi:CRP/FNR family cyclic AMP-dependent transcriptional regulator
LIPGIFPQADLVPERRPGAQPLSAERETKPVAAFRRVARMPLILLQNNCFKQTHPLPKGVDMQKKQKTSFNPRSLTVRDTRQKIVKQRKDQVVFSQGDPADDVFYIQKGKIRISVVSNRGKEAIVSILGPDVFFGEACMSGQALRISTAIALTETTLVRIGKQEMVQLLQQDADFSEMFIAHLVTRTIRVEADLIDQLFNSSERRLARLLLILANYGNEGKPEPILAKISQESLAEMIGTTRSRVSYFMNRFRKLGFITYNGHIEVHKSLLNLVLHEQPQIKN